MIPWRGLRDEWLMLGLAVLVALAALAHGHGKTEEPFVVELGVVPGDAADLACSGAGCAFDEALQATGVQQPLRPFVLLGGQRVVMSGVFESPKVQAWLSTHPQQGAKLSCPATLLAQAAQFGVRFRAADGFAKREVAVLKASDCEVR